MRKLKLKVYQNVFDRNTSVNVYLVVCPILVLGVQRDGLLGQAEGALCSGVEVTEEGLLEAENQCTIP